MNTHAKLDLKGQATDDRCIKAVKFRTISCRCDNKSLMCLVYIDMFPPHYSKAAPPHFQ